MSECQRVLSALQSAVPWRAGSSMSRWSIGQRIAATVLIVAVPLNIVILVAALQLTSAGREAQRTGLEYSARSVSAALDAQFEKYVALITALSRSPALLETDLSDFEIEARRMFQGIEEAWVVVAEPDGRQLLNTAVTDQSSLPPRVPKAIEGQQRAFAQRSVMLSDIRVGPVKHQWVATIEVPIFKGDQPYRALAVAMTMQPFFRLLSGHQLPANLVVGIIDSDGRYVARVPGGEALVGELASEGWRAVRLREGLFEFASREGDPLINVNAVPRLGRWTVGVAVKKAELQETAARTTRTAMLMGGLISLLTLTIAAIMARRITTPLAELGRAASSGATSLSAIALSAPPEIARLRSALIDAAERREVQDEQQTALLRLTSHMIEARQRDVLARLAFENISRVLGADVCLKYRLDSADRSLRLVFQHGLTNNQSFEAARLEVGQAFCGRLGETLRPLVAAGDRIDTDPAAAFLRRAGIRAYCCHPLRARDGSVLGTFAVGSSKRDAFDSADVAFCGTVVNILSQAIERIEAEEALRQSRDTFRHLVERSPFGVYTVDADFRLAQVSRGAQKVFENVRPLIGRDFGDVLRQIWREPFASEAIARFEHTLATGEEFRAVRSVERRADIDEIESYDWKIERIVMPDGRHGVVCHFYDLSDRERYEAELKAAHDRQAVLMKELAHRGKNLVAIVQAVAARSFTDDRPLAESRRIFAGRLQALANTFATFSETAAETVPLRDLVERELKAFSKRVEIGGPDVQLFAKAAQTFALLVHELATNATKHGALSVDEGSVAVTWTVEPGSDGPRISFWWRESGGPPPIDSGKRGFGTALLTMLPAEFGSTPELSLLQHGLEYRLEAKLAAVGSADRTSPSV